MYIHVKVTPGAKKENVEKVNDTEFIMMVKEQAKHNRANKRVIELLASEFGVSTADIKMLTGHRSGSKMFSIENVTSN